MKHIRFYHSLRFKITIGVVVPLFLSMVAFSYFQHVRHQALLMSNLEQTSTSLGKVIEGSLRHAMLSGDRDQLRQIADDIARQQGVKSLLIIDRGGRVRVASRPGQVGIKMDLSDPTCQICHQTQPQSRNHTVVYVTNLGERVFRNVNPITNADECHTCHDPRYKINGVLITDVSLAEMDAQLASDLRLNIALSLAGILFAAIAVNVTMNLLVTGKLERFIGTVRRFGHGNFEQRVPIRSSDEIGQLANAFNQMAESLSALNSVAATVSQSLHLNEILSDALDEVLDITGIESGAICLVDEAAGVLRMSVQRGLSETSAQALTVMPLEGSFAGEVIRSGEPAAERFIENDPHWQPAMSEGIQAVVGVPLKSKDKAQGVMLVMSPRPRPLSRQGVELLLAIGHQIGVAIENARLYEALEEKEALRGELLVKVIAAQEDERKRIARELHDELAQTLTALSMSMEAAHEVIPPEMSQVKAQFQRTKALADRTLEQTRKLILDLRPTMLDDLGLVPAIRWFAESRLEPLGVKVDLRVSGPKRRLKPEVETALFRIVQEAINNIAKHAAASQATIQLGFEDGHVIGVVEDDGQGFDLDEGLHSEDQSRRLGVLGMRERAALFGGTLNLYSRPGIGTRVIVDFPVEGEEVSSEQDSSISG